ncbi:hypothetical protein [Litoreibacter halocynthiae]|uniref:hypothetical protein n=1 Tax=Litoreibacter halocynthiae TaxID=1242689 RepID=UPI00248FD2E1|nr:hypothetical protein [Litoreibacter halocynthiae]
MRRIFTAPSGLDVHMFEWGYWRWQIIRCLPLGIVSALLLAATGWSVLEANPPKYAASARIVLERNVGLGGTSKAQRTPEEAQHLQVVAHALKADFSATQSKAAQLSTDAPIDANIESSRDKPTYLTIKSTMPDATAAIALAQTLSLRAIELSNGFQQHATDLAVNKLRESLHNATARLTTAEMDLRSHSNQSPDLRIEELQDQASRLRATLRAAESKSAPENPEVAKLYADLATARGLYSDLHPKVRLIKTRIDKAIKQSPADQTGQDLRFVKQRIQDIDAQIVASKDHQAITDRLNAAVSSAKARVEAADDRLQAAMHANEANRITLKVVKDASLTGRNPAKMRVALLATIGLAALLLAIVVAALRIRFDARLRRPRDLHDALGLTPFATLPDLGPSLG